MSFKTTIKYNNNTISEFTSDNTVTLPTNTKVMNGNIVVSTANTAADYVVETGTSGIWTYRKWNSGIAECWGIHTTSSPNWGTSNFGSATAYYSQNDVTWPFTFKVVPVVTLGPVDTGGGVCAGEIDGISTTSATLRIIGASNSWETATIHVHVYGKWK